MDSVPTCPIFPAALPLAKPWGETKQLIKEAITFHLEGLRDESASIPTATAIAEYVDV